MDSHHLFTINDVIYMLDVVSVLGDSCNVWTAWNVTNALYAKWNECNMW